MTVNTIPGGLGQIMAAILKLFFQPDGQDMSKTGILLKLHNGRSVHLFVKLGSILGDEEALRYMTGCKGHAGLKCCLQCSNVYNSKNERRIPDHDPTHRSIYHTCTEPNRFERATTDILRAIIVRLQNATPAELNDLQIGLGWTLEKAALLVDPALAAIVDPCKQIHFDWMHVFVVGGVFNNHMGTMMSALSKTRFTYQYLQQYLDLWTWPASVKKWMAKV